MGGFARKFGESTNEVNGHVPGARAVKSITASGGSEYKLLVTLCSNGAVYAYTYDQGKKKECRGKEPTVHHNEKLLDSTAFHVHGMPL